MRFELKAVSPEGRVESLDYQGLDEASVVQQAQGHGYAVLAVRERGGFPAALGAGIGLRRERFPLVLFSQELLVLLEAGLPLVEAVQTLAERERRREFRTLLSRIVAVMREGHSFSSALEQFPLAFPALYVATARASERTGDLAPALSRYVAYQNQIDSVKKRLINASIYPLLLLGAGGLVSLFLLLYVVPRFSRVYEDRNMDLPLFSRLLLTWGQAVEGHALLAVVVLAAVAAGLLYALTRPAVRAALGDALWRLPSIGERLKLYQLARFYRTIGMLLRGGVPLLAALAMGESLLHPVLRARLAAASRAISEGRPVSQSMEAAGLTTAVALRMLAVGEQGGNMGEMMDRIAGFHDDEISRWVDWFTRLFEPLLMAAIGLVIGGIVILMYMPVFELAGSLQ
ncbi:MAG TPA: type II secretion system F family protein [Burkholderiales bacterium]|nr:type II secretion system F family protein [Burkholderiales bacterium]